MNSKILSLRITAILLLLCALFGGTLPAFAQQAGGKKLSGQVVDDAKEPLIGVSILVVGTTLGTITDFDGNYTSFQNK